MIYAVIILFICVGILYITVFRLGFKMYCADKNIKELRDEVEYLSNREEIIRVVEELNNMSGVDKYYSEKGTTSVYNKYSRSREYMTLKEARDLLQNLKAAKYDSQKEHKCPDISTMGFPVNPGTTAEIDRCVIKNKSDKTVYIGEAKS